MAHVDALSRCVAHVGAMPLERELELRQLSDPRISQNLEFHDSNKFALIDGLIYRKVDFKFVIPESMVANVIRAHHDEMAYCGLEKTVKGIQKNYWFPSLRKRVQEYVDNCLTCIMSNCSLNKSEGETQLFPSPKSPLEVLHIDHFGSLNESSENYRYILVVVDAHTRFTWLFATRTTNSKETIACLSTIINTFGKPLEIVSDRGSGFTSIEFTDFMDYRLAIKHRKVAVAAPWANGLVERVNFSRVRLLNC